MEIITHLILTTTLEMDLSIISILSVRKQVQGGLKRLIGGLTAAKWQARMQTQEIWPQNTCWEPLCCEFNIYLLNKQIVE